MALRPVILVAVAIMACTGSNVAFTSAPYQAASVLHKDRNEKLAFDIPPQPLLSALRKYSEITGQAVLVDDAMTVGLHSSGVQGEFSQVDALLKILIGTGLTASYSSEQAFTLKAIDNGVHFDPGQHPEHDDVADESNGSLVERYAGEIQKPIEQALCRMAGIQAVDDRVALQIWITPTGHIQKAEVLSVSTDQRNAQILRAVNPLVLDPPPPTMPEPLTLLFFPRKAIAANRCAPPTRSAP